ncbi:TRAP transporter substrate-binding protein [Garciella nitratireducens]|uniref:Tripartite ATP-independent transporter solute receptor, DctP family n=1 Tax=Garciella nitratireducens DSM 15102 TaxID=1121911 RepID=A0A1T4P512_9FIRM|nr:TRAP transporter substrate-binding protein [Garciella nitratireducens]SJZ86018.1 tripartite ATP-independent transporter solute receptor, DctP family [Garciella nitratireducens DSM 15102]
MKKKIKIFLVLLATMFFVFSLMGCSISKKSAKNKNVRIIRVAHNQSEKHPTHIGLLAFEKYIKQNLGNKYDVQIFPNELLGSQVNTVELTQTGAIDFTVASNAILESFDDVYEIFNLPYLFSSPKHYHAVMDEEEIIEPIFTSTEDSGFEAVTWLDAGIRNFYTVNTPIEKPEDLKGLKIRVQQSATNVRMMELLGASASPMGFGEVYTALQSHVIDGAENNELALTNNLHGEVAKYYSYNMHQMVPDIVIGNLEFLNSLSKEERAIFEEGFEILNKVQRDAWADAIEEAKKEATEMGVEFLYPDIEPFKEAVLPLHEEVLEGNVKLKPVYEAIVEKEKEVSKEGE